MSVERTGLSSWGTKGDLWEKKFIYEIVSNLGVGGTTEIIGGGEDPPQGFAHLSTAKSQKGEEKCAPTRATFVLEQRPTLQECTCLTDDMLAQEPQKKGGRIFLLMAASAEGRQLLT